MADIFGFSNSLVSSNPGGFQFFSRWNDAKSSYNRVSLTFQSLDVNDLVVGNYYITAEQNGDFAIGYNYNNPVLLIDYSTKNLKITDGIDIILGTSTGTKIGTATTQKIGFWNAAPFGQTHPRSRFLGDWPADREKIRSRPRRENSWRNPIRPFSRRYG